MDALLAGLQQRIFMVHDESAQATEVSAQG